MNRVGCTYNIRYDMMSDEDWRRLASVYEAMPNFVGYDSSGCPAWFGPEDENRAHLWASVEPSGLLVEGFLDADVWQKWHEAFMAQASQALGFEVKDAGE